MPVDAVVFDWGGTLSVWADLDIGDMWDLAARHLAPDREDEVRAQLRAVEAEAWAAVEKDQASTSLSAVLAKASTALGLDVAEAVLEALHHLDAWTPHIAHDPDALPVLAAIHQQGIRTGLLSNTLWPRAFHEHFLERDGLSPYLDVRCYTSEMQHTKPHPEAFRTALRALDVEAGRTVFVGDRLFDDVYGASMLGLHTVWRRNSFTPAFDVDADASVDTLPELLGVLEKWLADGDR
jgi:putative hydrolase of the HAD superfamily